MQEKFPLLLLSATLVWASIVYECCLLYDDRLRTCTGLGENLQSCPYLWGRDERWWNLFLLVHCTLLRPRQSVLSDPWIPPICPIPLCLPFLSLLQAFLAQCHFSKRKGNQFEFTYIYQTQKWREKLLNSKWPYISEEIALRKIPSTKLLGREIRYWCWHD